jgi:hypothetical protein
MALRMLARLLLVLVALASAAPAWAEDSTAVPEGSHATLFALGLLGVIIGRRASMNAHKRGRGDEPDAD